MKKQITAIALIFSCGLLSSCYVNKFDVGKGAQTHVETKQWNHYVIGGLIPVGVANPKLMADNAQDYTVTVKHSFLNLLVSGVTFSIYSPTTTVVEK